MYHSSIIYVYLCRLMDWMKGMVVKYVEAKKDVWDEYLDSCVFAYNTSSHESSLHSPFEVMFGQKAIIPTELAYHKARK